MKAPKIKVGTLVLRWNGVSNDKGIIFSTTKKKVVVLWKGVKETIEKDLLKYQAKISATETVWNWRASTPDIEETFDEKIEDDWIKTYDRAGELASMKLTEEVYKRDFWFLRDPYELMTELGYTVEEGVANELENFLEGKWIDVYYWFVGTCQNQKNANEIIKWMMGPLKEAMSEREIEDLKYGSSFLFHAVTFGLLVEKVISKDITATMGKDVLRRMFDGEELEKILEDDKYKISSDDEMTKFVKDIIEANPGQVEELKAGKEKILMWLVGQVMKASRGKANAAEVKKMLTKELNL